MCLPSRDIKKHHSTVRLILWDAHNSADTGHRCTRKGISENGITRANVLWIIEQVCAEGIPDVNRVVPVRERDWPHLNGTEAANAEKQIWEAGGHKRGGHTRITVFIRVVIDRETGVLIG